MINKKSAVKFTAVLLILAAFFTACKSMPAAKGGIKMQKGMELAAWEGEWVSLDVVSEDASLQPVYKDVADKMANYTLEGFKSAVSAMYETPVVKAKFDGTNTVVFTVLDADNNKKEISCEYAYKGTAPVPGYDGYYWYTFEAVKDVRGLSKAKYMVLFPPHKDSEDGMLHWHGRFGGRSIDALAKAADFWWPTYVMASMPKEELLQNAKNSLQAIPQFLAKSPFEAYAKEGKWINSSLIYDNTSAEVAAVYAKLIKEFAGKNPKGGDFTRADIVMEMKKVYGTGEDFSYLEFDTKDGKNELVVYKDDKEIFRSGYKRSANTDKGSLTVTADNKNAGKFAMISMTGSHGDPAHFHLWYGANEKDYANVQGRPTCVPVNAPNARIAVRVENTCRRTLKALTEKK